VMWEGAHFLGGWDFLPLDHAVLLLEVLCVGWADATICVHFH
jgi:hypothetical protein